MLLKDIRPANRKAPVVTTRKKRDTSKKRESIVDAAIEVFQAEGYDNASMDRIAERADASKRTVYNHFPSKDILFEAVIERFMRETVALKEIPYDPARSLEAQLDRFANAKLAVLSCRRLSRQIKTGIGQ